VVAVDDAVSGGQGVITVDPTEGDAAWSRFPAPVRSHIEEAEGLLRFGQPIYDRVATRTFRE
jgi:hypothetical protein